MVQWGVKSVVCAAWMRVSVLRGWAETKPRRRRACGPMWDLTGPSTGAVSCVGVSCVLWGGPLCGGSPVWGVPCVVQALGAIFDSVLIKCHSKRPCQIFTSMFPAQPDGTRYSISVTGQLKTHTNQAPPPPPPPLGSADHNCVHLLPIYKSVLKNEN